MSDRLAEIRRRAELATPGPWTYSAANPYPIGEEGFDPVSGPQEAVWGPPPSESRTYCVAMTGPASEPGSANDAEFVAHAREDVTWLIAEIDRLSALTEDKRYM